MSVSQVIKLATGKTRLPQPLFSYLACEAEDGSCARSMACASLDGGAASTVDASVDELQCTEVRLQGVQGKDGGHRGNAPPAIFEVIRRFLHGIRILHRSMLNNGAMQGVLWCSGYAVNGVALNLNTRTLPSSHECGGQVIDQLNRNCRVYVCKLAQVDEEFWA